MLVLMLNVDWRSKLNVGLDVNLRFNSPTAFEATRELTVFDLLGIDLVHGWVVSTAHCGMHITSPGALSSGTVSPTGYYPSRCLMQCGSTLAPPAIPVAPHPCTHQLAA